MFVSSPYDVAAKAQLTPANFTVGQAVPATTDTGSASESHYVDSRRYSKFDRTVSQTTGTTSMSFGDVLDMINPLQHIPIVSATYRAVTGESIHPVAHVVGDIMFGGAIGIAPAIFGATGAVTDESMKGKTGKGALTNMYASLFGRDEASASEKKVQVASADNATTQENAAKEPSADKIQVASASSSDAPTQLLAQNASTPADGSVSTAPLNSAKGFPLNRNKMAFGGVMAQGKDMQAQNMAMSIASSTGIRIGNTVYANRLAHGGRALPAAPIPASAIAANNTKPSTDKTDEATGRMNPLMSALPQDSLGATPLPEDVMATIKGSGAAPAATPDATTKQGALKTSDATGVIDEGNTMPESLRDDALLLKALGLYQNVAKNAAPNVANNPNNAALSAVLR